MAQRLFREAADLRRAEQWELSARKLREAIALKETPGLRFHLAHCEEKLGRLVEAQVEYDRVQELITAGARAPDVLPLLAAARSALKERVPTLRVRIEGAPEAARFTVDGAPVSPRLIGEAVPLNPGEHQIAVEVEGHRKVAFTVALTEGEQRVLDVSPGPPLSPREQNGAEPLPAGGPGREAPLPPQAAESGGFGLREGVLASEAIVSLAGVGLGLYFVLAGDRASTRAKRASREIPSGSSACSGPDAPSACGELASAVQDRRSAQDWALGSFVGAGVGAAALATTWLLWPGEPAASRRSAIVLVPAATGPLVVGFTSF